MAKPCECAARLDALERKLSAYMGLQQNHTPSGMAPFKCQCGMIATRTVFLKHPVAGQSQGRYCDWCMPRDVYGDGKSTLHSEDYGTVEDAAWARAINNALRGE